LKLVYYVDIDAVILHSASTTASTFPDCPGIPGAFHFRATGNALLYCAKFKNGLLGAAEKLTCGLCGSFYYFVKAELIVLLRAACEQGVAARHCLWLKRRFGG